MLDIGSFRNNLLLVTILRAIYLASVMRAASPSYSTFSLQRFPASGTKSLPTRHSPTSTDRRSLEERERAASAAREPILGSVEETRDEHFSYPSLDMRRRLLTQCVKSGNRRRESICSFAPRRLKKFPIVSTLKSANITRLRQNAERER